MPEGTDSASDKKCAEQSDENISRTPKKFQERKGEGIGESETYIN